jgi:hypothetical protein
MGARNADSASAEEVLSLLFSREPLNSLPNLPRRFRTAVAAGGGHGTYATTPISGDIRATGRPSRARGAVRAVPEAW